MNDLLTTRQVQDILKVDRITVYRMLQDGRLKGVKIGQQWRFPAAEVDRLLNPCLAVSLDEAPLNTDENALFPAAAAAAPRGHGPMAFPTHCAQIIQDMYAGMGKTGAVTVDTQGAPLTEMSQPCRFCALLRTSPSGEAACQQSWQKSTRSGSRWFTCHAGLRCLQAPIHENGVPAAYLISGQGYHTAPEPTEQQERVEQLAAQHSLDAAELLHAAAEIPVYTQSQIQEMETWPEKYTRAIESILKERAGLVGKLQKIAEITMA